MVFTPKTRSKAAMMGMLPPRRTARGRLPKATATAVFGCLIGGQVDGAEVGFAAVHRRDLDADVLRSDALDVVDEGLADLVVVLVGYEAARDLSMRP